MAPWRKTVLLHITGSSTSKGKEKWISTLRRNEKCSLFLFLLFLCFCLPAYFSLSALRFLFVFVSSSVSIAASLVFNLSYHCSHACWRTCVFQGSSSAWKARESVRKGSHLCVFTEWWWEIPWRSLVHMAFRSVVCIFSVVDMVWRKSSAPASGEEDLQAWHTTELLT